MATATIADGTLTLELRQWDKILALHGTLKIPLEHITSATSGEAPPVPWFAPLKVVGTSLPGVMAAGTFYSYHDGLVFYDYGAGHECLILALQHEQFTKVVIEIDPPQAAASIAAQVREATGRPG
jgi:hypothetical protein